MMAASTVTIGIPTYNRPHWLKRSIESALSQSITNFRLLIADNASDYRTREIVESFDDDRIEYVRLPVNIGMTPNINRVIELTQTDFLVILPDDDLLYPDYLQSTLAILESNPEAGVVHTAFDLMGGDGRIIEEGRSLMNGRASVGIDRGYDVIELGMRSSGLACWTSCLFRTKAISAAGGLRVEDEPFADGPLIMRIALDWDIGRIPDPLVAVRLHEQAVSAMSGSFTEGKFDPDDTLPEILLRQRMRFLDEAGLPAERTRHYRSVAMETHRRHTIGLLWEQIGRRRGRSATLRQLFELGRSDPRMLFVPGMLKLLAALVAGRPVEFLRFRHRPTLGHS
jgi:glycosyltransferase involved in cell wall biosynthesis